MNLRYRFMILGMFCALIFFATLAVSFSRVLQSRGGIGSAAPYEPVRMSACTDCQQLGGKPCITTSACCDPDHTGVVCCPSNAPYLNLCDCKCYSNSGDIKCSQGYGDCNYTSCQ